jgi:hypothetical protein
MLALTKVLPALISNGSFTGSFSGTSSYSRRALTASYALNASGGGGGSSGTSGASGGGASLRTGSTYPITSSFSRRAITASYALKALTASYIANFPIINNVQAQVIVPSITGSSYTLIRQVANSADIFVSINGVVQIPASSYTISGNTINFSQIPTSGSRIDVRFLLSGNNVSSSYAQRALTASYVLGGAAGSSGTSGATGVSGSSGTSGATGVSGSSGSSGTSGATGVSGSSGSSGATGTSGSSGNSGSSGSSGATGASGSSGNSGSSGSSGATGASGSSGTSGAALITGSTYPITSSFSRRAITASYAMNGGGGGGQTFPFSGSAVITGSLSITKTLKINNVTLSASNGSLYLNNSLLRVLRYNYFSSSISSSNIIPVVNVRTQIINGYSLISADLFVRNLSSGSQGNVYIYNGANSTLIQTITINQSTINILSLSDYVPLQISASGYLNFRVTASVI